MTEKEYFAFRSPGELLAEADRLGINLPFQEDTAPLFEPLAVGSRRLPNRLVVQPMEGFDAADGGAPGEWTRRRYLRYAGGGSGTIWFEAVAVVPEGRSNPRQLRLHSGNVDSFKKLVDRVRQAAGRASSREVDPFLILQLSHSGRYSRPDGHPRPAAAVSNPHLDRQGQDSEILSDDRLDRLQDQFVETARLARQAGFDGVDIKACHGYLVNELLGARQRRNSRYGGSLENRCRFLLEAGRRVAEIPGMVLAVRLSAYDGLAHPFGFGVSPADEAVPDLGEVKVLMGELVNLGCRIVNVSAGNPHVKPHITRPFDRGMPGSLLPPEHPLQGVSRLIGMTGKLQSAFEDLPMVGSGYSWLRRFYPMVAAAVIRQGKAALVGLGRSSFAYPAAPLNLLKKGSLDPEKVCTCCSRCSELMRSGCSTGCVIRDRRIYGKLYRKIVAKEK